MGIAAGIGAVLEPPQEQGRLDAEWFGESGARILVTATSARREEITRVAARHDVPLRILGSVGGTDLDLGSFGSISIDRLGAASERALTLVEDHQRLEIDSPVVSSYPSHWG